MDEKTSKNDKLFRDRSLVHGFQIWLNLPAAEKMKPAAYEDIASADIAEQRLPGGGLVRVIAGDVTINHQALQGPLPERSTQPVLLDVQLVANETVELSFSADNPALVYTYNGATDLLTARQLGIYVNGSALQLTAGPSGAELLVLSGQPIDEPVAQHGPFVMNTPEQIERALKDFQDPQFLRQLASNRDA